MRMNDKKHRIFAFMIGFLAFLCLSAAAISFSEMKADTSVNVPQFYGMTKAIVQKDSEFDISQAHLRIFARDVDDGDLTDQIKVVSNNVDTSVIGNYEVVYQVTDSDQHTVNITVPVEVVENGDGAYYERTIYTLPSVDHMPVTGPRGNGMDRQMTGLMLRGNATIRVKKVSGPDLDGHSFANSASSKNMKINGNWQEISYPNVNTLLIKTPYKVEGPVVVAINVPEGEDVIEMPYYHYKDDEAKFRAYWNSIEGDSVGLIENQSIAYFILPIDKGKFNGFVSLDAGLEFFDQVMTEYDELLGYDYYASDPWDQNVKTKYFVIGAGANNGALAYYSEAAVVWAGSNTPTSNGFAAGWAILHEVGHGYQGGGLKEDSGMGLIETSNNILAYYVQNRSETLSSSVGGNWLGEIADREDAINQKRLQGTTFRQLSASEKLYVLVNLLDLYDYKETYSYIASKVREMNYKGIGGNYSLAEKYTISFHELYGVNVSSYFEAWGENISQSVKELVKNDKTIVMINDVITDKEMATQVKSDLNKDGIYSLVTMDQLEAYELKGNAKITIEIPNLADISGKELEISNGEKTYTAKITSNEVNIELPVGSYQIKLPVPKQNVYSYNPYFSIEVKNNETSEYTVSYRNNVDEVLTLDTELYLNGQMSGSLAKITFTKDKIQVTSGGGFTHVGWNSNTNYAKVEVLDLNDQVIYTKEYRGNSYTSRGYDEIPYKIGYKVVAYHAEGLNNRFRIIHRYTNTDATELKKVNGENVYIIGEYGLYQESESYDLYKERVDAYAQKLLAEMSEEEIADKNVRSGDKGILLASILKLKEEDQAEYLEKYDMLCIGGKPELLTTSVTLHVGDELADLYPLLKATDLEDGEFALNETNASFEGFTTEKVGTISVNYTIQDLDGNQTVGTLTIIVEPKADNDDPNLPNQDSNNPKGDNPTINAGNNNSGGDQNHSTGNNGNNMESINTGDSTKEFSLAIIAYLSFIIFFLCIPKISDYLE